MLPLLEELPVSCSIGSDHSLLPPLPLSNMQRGRKNREEDCGQVSHQQDPPLRRREKHFGGKATISIRLPGREEHQERRTLEA